MYHENHDRTKYYMEINYSYLGNACILHLLLNDYYIHVKKKGPCQKKDLSKRTHHVLYFFPQSQPKEKNHSVVTPTKCGL